MDRISSVVVGSPISSSDHSTILVLPLNYVNVTGVEHTLYDLRASNIGEFIHTLENYDFSTLYHTDSIDEKATILNTVLKDALHHIPVRYVNITSSDKVWMTPKVKLLINQRWCAFRNKNWPLYNHLKMKCKLEIVKAKKSWANCNFHSSKKLWSVVNSITGKNNSLSLDSLCCDGVQKFVNEANDVFTSHFNASDTTDFNLPDYNFNDWSPNISEDWVYKELVALDPSKSIGSDGIPTCLYSYAAHAICKPICHIINDSILRKRVPLTWKHAHIIPIPKCYTDSTFASRLDSRSSINPLRTAR